MNVEVHHADPRFRRIATLLLLGVLLLGGLGIWALREWLQAHARASQPDFDGLLMLAAGLVAVLATVSFGIAAALWLEARRIQHEDRFPPSDMRTLRDVPVRHGAQALRYARYMMAGAIVAGISGCGILLWGYRLLRLVS
jgi:hypothetical protein